MPANPRPQREIVELPWRRRQERPAIESLRPPGMRSQHGTKSDSCSSAHGHIQRNSHSKWSTMSRSKSTRLGKLGCCIPAPHERTSLDMVFHRCEALEIPVCSSKPLPLHRIWCKAATNPRLRACNLWVHRLDKSADCKLPHGARLRHTECRRLVRFAQPDGLRCAALPHILENMLTTRSRDQICSPPHQRGSSRTDSDPRHKVVIPWWILDRPRLLQKLDSQHCGHADGDQCTCQNNRSSWSKH